MRMSHNFQERRYSEHPHQLPAREELRRDGTGMAYAAFVALCLIGAAKADAIADLLYAWVM